MRTTPYSSILMTMIVCFSCVPPLVGFTVAMAMSGYVYDFPNGCLPVIIGAFLGAIITFTMIRQLHLSDWLKAKKRYATISNALKHGGFRMIVLIRLCPIPWQLTSVVLSINDCISFRAYCIASCVSSFKLIWAVWIGSKLASLNDTNLPPDMHRYTIMSLGIGLTILTAAGIWLYRLTLQEIKEKKAEEEPLLGHSNNATTRGRL